MTTRTTAAQGTTVRLYIVFRKNAVLADPYTLPTVTMIDPLGVTQATDLTLTKESEGRYYFDYALPGNAAVGEWTDRYIGVVYDSGMDPVNIDLNFYCQESSWEGITPDVCNVWETILEQDGDPRIGISGTAKIISTPYSYGNAYYSSTQEGDAVSDSSGKISWNLVYGATVRIEIPDIKLEKIIIVPDKPSAQLQDIAEVE